MAKTIETLDNRPWVPHHIPSSIRKELYRRTLDQGMKYVKDVELSGYYDDENTWKSYRGPLSAWIRITSNGTGITKNPSALNALERREGFILYGGQGFYDSIGKLNFNDGTTYKPSILGYDTNGLPHYLDLGTAEYPFPETNPNRITPNPELIFQIKDRPIPLFSPSPGVVSIEASMQKERIRKVSINWKCYNFSQLEYMVPYFLTPGISLIVEFGWNLFNINSLLNLQDTNELKQLWVDGTSLYDRSILSNGMYDVTFGSIVNFEFGTQDGSVYDCKTEIYSKHRNYTGALLNDSSKETKIEISSQDNEVVTGPTFYEFCNQRLKTIEKCFEGEGKNFFDPLTKEEEEKWLKNGINFSELKKTFYDGKKENRIFIGRGRVYGDPLTIHKTVNNVNYISVGRGSINQQNTSYTALSSTADKEDWDYSKPDDVWVTMGFVIELLNTFITLKTKVVDDKNKNLLLNKINIEDVVVGAHPNLISTDGSKVLIPNAMAPKYNLGYAYWKDPNDPTQWSKNKFQAQTTFLNNNKYVKSASKIKKGMLEYDLKIFNVFKMGYGIDYTNQDSVLGSYFASLFSKKIDIDTYPLQRAVYRNNLDTIINRFKYNQHISDKTKQITEGSAAFPQLITCPLNNKAPYYWGYLKDLYVHVNVIIEAAKNAKTVEDFLNTILNTISAAAAGFWELAVVESEKELKIIDKKFISNSIYENLFQFDVASDTCIKSITFTVTPSNIQMNQTIAGSSNNRGNNTGQSTSNQLPDFVYGDRLGVSELVSEDNKTPTNTAIDVIKQFQTYGNKIGGTYNMTFGELNSDLYEIINLSLPSTPLLLSILDCEDYEDNNNIYGGQQPNFTLELILQGISGLRTFQCFSIKNLPKPYSPEEVIFQIIDITHSLENGDWSTTIKAGIRPLNKFRWKTQPIYIFSTGKEEFDNNQKTEIENKS